MRHRRPDQRWHDRIPMLATEMIGQESRPRDPCSPIPLRHSRPPARRATTSVRSRFPGHQRVEELQVLAGNDGPVESASARSRPRAANRLLMSSSRSSRSIARVQLGTSPQAPASPRRRRRYGISPLLLPMTATPEAIASINMRPNCSRHFSVVRLGAHRTLMAVSQCGISPCGIPVTTCTRPPCDAANARSSPSSGPPPTSSACHGAVGSSQCVHEH